MWIFVRYGFYSIACASKPDGSLDPETVMVRARCEDHLLNLRDRFPAIADAKIVTLPDRDYRYRLIVPKLVWVPILAELANEQDWSNFKNEAAAYQGKSGASYSRALHEVWGVMCRLSAGSKSTQPETVLEVGSEGGSITLLRERNAGERWQFQVKTNENALYDALSEEDRNSIGEHFAQTGYVQSFDEALPLLDRYPWYRLVPLTVHPQFLDAVLLAVRERGGITEETRWRDRLATRPGEF